ncbi:MAG: hypothetical protein ACTJGD_08660 [Mesonia hippocampi]|uniref:hypothetical protein n=1 Tax=Mesonia hippocampi TaxID=1628250 RepID=UPI003F9D660F
MKLTQYIFLFLSIIILSCNNSRNNDNTHEQTIEDNTSDLPIENNLTEDFTYIKNPNSSDKTCISDIEKAKTDIQNGKLSIVYTNYEVANMRYEHFIEKLCNEYGFSFKIDFIDDILEENQTQGCYKSYMDMVITDSLGLNFKNNLENKADSLYLSALLAENHAEWYFRCDTKPKPILNKRKYLETTLTLNDLDIKQNPKGNVWPSVDIEFIIELDGEITNIKSSNFIPKLSHNKKFKETLYKIGVNYIKENYPKWEPGKIRETNVRTRNNVRLTFVKE